MTAVLEVKDLSVRFATPDGAVSAVNNVSFRIDAGECLGVVGESGSGKSQLFMAVLGLLASNGHVEGSACYNGQELIGMPVSGLNRIRGRKISVIFQDGMTALTPHMKIGRQMTEVLTWHMGLSVAEARARAREMLDLVRISDAERRLDQYPHELSGGMRQRVMIAMALLCGPDLLIADEPTTALDVTVQAEILDLFADLRRETGAAIVLITHDMGTVAGLCDRVQVMYGGQIMETGDVRQIFYSPRHPYSWGLLASMPRIDAEGAAGLYSIPGQPVNLQHLPPGCPFQARCEYVHDHCRSKRPILRRLEDGHLMACHLEGMARPPFAAVGPAIGEREQRV